MRFCTAVIAAALLSRATAGAASPTSVAAAEAASCAFDSPQIPGDVAALERSPAPDFLYIRGSGRVADRRAFANLSDRPQHLEPFVMSDRRLIPLSRNAVVVNADGIISGMVAGQPFREHFRHPDTFVRRGGRWHVVNVQGTPVGS